MRRPAIRRASVPIGNLEAAFRFTLTRLQSTINCSSILRAWRENPELRVGLQFREKRKERPPMISRRSILLAMATTTLSGGSLPVLAGSRRLNPIRMFDTDNDG